MNILITGGAGFVGCHVAGRLVKEGHRVIIADNFVTGKIDNVCRKAVFYPVDILDGKLADVFAKEKPEVVIHNAAQVNVRKSLDNPAFDARTNIIGTINVLECCRKSKTRKIILASSAAVYGNPQYLGLDEDHPVNPTSGYGVSKYTAEQYIKLYNGICGLCYTILRYSNVYGPYQGCSGEGGVVCKFLKSILSGKQPVIYGSGEQTRDFIYAEDIAEANLLALHRGDQEIVNISTGERHSINALLDLICSATGNRAIPIREGFVKGDIMHSYLDNTKAREVLGWKPDHTLTEGLLKTVRYYKRLYSANEESEEGVYI